MCYTGGPRCSPHAKQALTKAEASGDKELIKTARQDYYLTPAGIAKIRASGKTAAADKLQAKRSEMIARSKEISQNNEIIRNQMQEFEGDPYHGQIRKQIDHYTKQYGQPLLGRTRAVFDRGDGYMVKVPMNGEGLMANQSEIMTHEAKDPYIPVAECRMETDYSVVPEGMPVLVMEKVDIESASKLRYKDMPDWVGSVDCGQVGYDRKGRLVAYDL